MESSDREALIEKAEHARACQRPTMAKLLQGSFFWDAIFSEGASLRREITRWRAWRTADETCVSRTKDRSHTGSGAGCRAQGDNGNAKKTRHLLRRNLE